MSPEVGAALVAGIFSVITLLANLIILFLNNRAANAMQRRDLQASEGRLRMELETERDQWRRGFEADVNRGLVLESNLEIIRHRIEMYGKVWDCLKITAGHEWKKLTDPCDAVQKMVDQLSIFAYSDVGLMMSNRSRKLLLELRGISGEYLKGLADYEDVKRWAHLLKHSLRADIGISTEEFDNEFQAIAKELRIVD